ncbi:MAG: asparaginase [Hyphomicrobiales bacterium]|nr:asparaginase [Hyphomicrobiales bacterium]
MNTASLFVDVLRGGHVESRHAISAAIIDADGAPYAAFGDVARPIFPRSSIKVIQALPLVESGAADALGLSIRELALATASHNGEPVHVETARAMLARVDRDETCLACGPQWPGREDDRGRLHREGLRPSRLHNNCSGKHAGFVCAACHQGMDPSGYERVDHPLHRQIAAALSDVAGVDLADAPRGVDGCSIPTWAIPLEALARGFAKLTTGVGLAPDRARAATRLIDAALAEPFMIAGTGRWCTDLIEAFDRRIYVKIGAEGVYVAALPDEGLAVALKCADGAARAAEVAIATILARLTGRVDDPALARFLAAPLEDWNGATVGEVRAGEGAEAITAIVG